MITSKTSFLALIGNPVSHSLSPIIQNAAIRYLELDLIYIAIPCKNEDLKIVVNSLIKKGNKAFFAKNLKEISKILENEVKNNEIIITQGAGNVVDISNSLLAMYK